MKFTETLLVPDVVAADEILVLQPNQPDDLFYRQRVDRNLGWITWEEQLALKNKTVGIAGCGGMGGALAERLLRLGVGEIRLADCENFDVSNINRQLAARRSTIGKNKALETARILRGITDDARLVVYPQGITQQTTESFVRGCDLVCDEIEFWELSAAIILHQAARGHGIPILGCSTAGFGSHLFLFTPSSMTIEQAFGLTLEQAKQIDEGIRSGKISAGQKRKVMEMLVRVVTPALQDYCPGHNVLSKQAILEQLLASGRAPILSTNPALATGFIANHVLLLLLKESGIMRDAAPVPPMPGYLYLDAAKMLALTVDCKEWYHAATTFA